MSAKRKKLLVICPFPEGVAAGQRLKYEQYFDDWRAAGFDITTSCYMDAAMWKVVYQKGYFFAKAAGVLRGHLRRIRDLFRIARYDAVYVFMWVTPFGTSIFERLTCSLAKKLVYDVEDNVLVSPRRITSHPNPLVEYLRSRNKGKLLLRHADHVIVASPFLQNAFREFNRYGRCDLIPPSVDMDRFKPAPNTDQKSGGIVKIGWTGTFSSASYLDLLKPVFMALAKRVNFRLIVIGNFDYSFPEIDLTVLRWSLAEEVQQMQSIDIGVYPLPFDDWSDGKAGLKIIQYQAFGIPCVATDTGTSPLQIQDGATGFLVRTEAEWVDTLEKLVRNEQLRQQIGKAGREDALRHYSRQVVAQKYRAVLQFSE